MVFSYINRVLMCFLFVFCSFIISNIAFAASGEVVASFPESVYFFAHNPKTPEIYASTNDSVLVIDSASPKIITKIFVGGNLRGLDVSEDGTRLYVAVTATRQVAVIDLVSRSLLPPIQLPWEPYDLKVGSGGQLYATIYDAMPFAKKRYSLKEHGKYGIMLVNTVSNKFIKFFGDHISVDDFGVLDNSFLQISPDKKTLYSATKGWCPSSLYKFDVSTTNNPKQIYLNNDGSLGQDGKALKLAPTGDYLYYAQTKCSPDYECRYEITPLKTSDMSIQKIFSTSRRSDSIAIAFSPDGKIAYVDNNHGWYDWTIELWDAGTQEKLCEYNINKQEPNDFDNKRQLIVSSNGNYLFSAHEKEVKVFRTGSCGQSN